MARYTIELRNIGNLFGEEEVKKWFSNYELSDFLTPEEIAVINERGTWNKERLANKIYNHYFMREIGFETPALFRNRVESTMQEIMEEYLPLIYSAAIKYDPLVNVDYTETYEHEGQSNSSTSGTGNSTSSSTNNGNGLTINSDTPQSNINKQAILNGSYASSTSANESSNNISDTSSNTSTSSTDNNDSDNYTKRIKGNSGVSTTAQKLIGEYRDNIRAIDREIIEKLEPLFMGIF